MTTDSKLTLLYHYYRSHDLWLSLADIKLIQSLAKSMDRHAVNLCNVPDYQETYDKAVSKAREKVLNMVLKHNNDLFPNNQIEFKQFNFTGDPRGQVMSIKAIDPVHGHEVLLYPNAFN